MVSNHAYCWYFCISLSLKYQTLVKYRILRISLIAITLVFTRLEFLFYQENGTKQKKTSKVSLSLFTQFMYKASEHHGRLLKER